MRVRALLALLVAIQFAHAPPFTTNTTGALHREIQPMRRRRRTQRRARTRRRQRCGTVPSGRSALR